MLGGSSPGKARKSYRATPKPRMSSAMAGRRCSPSRPNKQAVGLALEACELAPLGRAAGASDTNLDTGSYRAFGEGRFLSRAFMEYGWNHLRGKNCRARDAKRA
jgi:hypothetical protein